MRLLCPVPRACPISCFAMVSILLGSKLDVGNNILPNGSDVNIVISILVMKPLLSRLMYYTPCVDSLVFAPEVSSLIISLLRILGLFELSFICTSGLS